MSMTIENMRQILEPLGFDADLKKDFDIPVAADFTVTIRVTIRENMSIGYQYGDKDITILDKLVVRRKSKNADQLILTQKMILDVVKPEDILSKLSKTVTPEADPRLTVATRRNKMSAMEKLALDTGLDKVIQKKDYGTAIRWFKKYDFQNIPSDIDKMIVLGDYCRSETSKKGLKSTTIIKINWEKRKFETISLES